MLKTALAETATLNDGLRNLVLEPLMALTSLVLAFFIVIGFLISK